TMPLREAFLLHSPTSVTSMNSSSCQMNLINFPTSPTCLLRRSMRATTTSPSKTSNPTSAFPISDTALKRIFAGDEHASLLPVNDSKNHLRLGDQRINTNGSRMGIHLLQPIAIQS